MRAEEQESEQSKQQAAEDNVITGEDNPSELSARNAAILMVRRTPKHSHSASTGANRGQLMIDLAGARCPSKGVRSDAECTGALDDNASDMKADCC